MNLLLTKVYTLHHITLRWKLSKTGTQGTGGKLHLLIVSILFVQFTDTVNKQSLVLT